MKDGLLMIVKFFFFLLLLPVIIAAVLAFQFQVFAIPAPKEQWLLWGMVLFVLVYLFLYNFKEVHSFGQTTVSNLLKFYQPLSAVGGLIIPIYAMLVVCVFLIINVLGLGEKYQHYGLLALGFTVAMHIVLTAQQMYEEDKSALKAQYLFGFGSALVVMLLIISLLISVVVADFSFINFISSLSSKATIYYKAIYRILFVSPT
jgi:hypothetical protein